MNSDTTFQTTTTSSEGTSKIGAALARVLKGGETIEMVGDLGAGKTTLAQGLIHSLGYKNEVTSPTFTLSRDYPVRNEMTVHHFDFYRLSGHDIVTDELAEFFDDPKSINLIEWPDHGAGDLPADRIVIKLIYGQSENEREISVESSRSQLIKELKNVFGA